jgi:hypothetical protein
MEVGNELRAALFEVSIYDSMDAVKLEITAVTFVLGVEIQYQIKYGASEGADAGAVTEPPPPPPPALVPGGQPGLGMKAEGGERDEEQGGPLRRPTYGMPAQRAVVRVNGKNASIAAPPGDAHRPQHIGGSNLVEVEGERMSLAPLPLPPRAAASSVADRTTDSQRRALDRLRQQHLHKAAATAHQPRKVMNYSVPPSSEDH